MESLRPGDKYGLPVYMPQDSTGIFYLPYVPVESEQRNDDKDGDHSENNARRSGEVRSIWLGHASSRATEHPSTRRSAVRANQRCHGVGGGGVAHELAGIGRKVAILVQ